MRSPIKPGEYDFYHPIIRFVTIPRRSMKIMGIWEDLVLRLVRVAISDSASREKGENAEERLQQLTDGMEREGRIVIPVHELQLPHVLEKIKDVRMLGGEWRLEGEALASLRCVCLNLSLLLISNHISRTISFSHPSLCGLALKLPLGLKVTSALRTISHWSGDFGVRFSEAIAPYLSLSEGVIIEVCSAFPLTMSDGTSSTCRRR
jgi:hypothetical protein